MKINNGEKTKMTSKFIEIPRGDLGEGYELVENLRAVKYLTSGKNIKEVCCLNIGGYDLETEASGEHTSEEVARQQILGLYLRLHNGGTLGKYSQFESSLKNRLEEIVKKKVEEKSD